MNQRYGAARGVRACTRSSPNTWGSCTRSSDAIARRSKNIYETPLRISYSLRLSHPKIIGLDVFSETHWSDRPSESHLSEQVLELEKHVTEEREDVLAGSGARGAALGEQTRVRAPRLRFRFRTPSCSSARPAGSGPDPADGPRRGGRTRYLTGFWSRHVGFAWWFLSEVGSFGGSQGTCQAYGNARPPAPVSRVRAAIARGAGSSAPRRAGSRPAAPAAPGT